MVFFAFGKSTLSGFVSLTTRLPISSSTNGDGIGRTLPVPAPRSLRTPLVPLGAAQLPTSRGDLRCAQLSCGLALTTLALALAATATGGPAAPAAIAGCAKASLNLVEEGKLSLATDNPAFDPWWTGGSKSKDWEINDPRTGKGYESAVAYGIAKRLGFSKAQVEWQVVPFGKSYRPRQEVIRLLRRAGLELCPSGAGRSTFSASYYRVNQAVAALETNSLSKVRSFAGLKSYRARRCGRDHELQLHRQLHQADAGARVYDTVNDAVSALKNKQIDGLVHDFPSMGYVTNVQVPGSTRRRSPAEPGRAGALRPRLPEGQPARPLREQGDQPDARGRDPEEARGALAGADGRSDPEVAAA